MKRAFRVGILIWLLGTVAIRLGGHRLLRASEPGRAVILYVASFAAMALLVPWICRRLKLDRGAWFPAATLLMLPTLLLDPFSCLFFTRIFPGADPAAAGVFGGWMLICCGGAVVGVWARR